MKFKILTFLTSFTQLTARLKNFLRGWLLVLSLKEGLVECAIVCVKSEVILLDNYKLGDRKLKFDWLDFIKKEPKFWGLRILNSFQNMIRPWNLNIWALGWWNQANQILTCDSQVLIWLVVIWTESVSLFVCF